jgi:hypothetical protein
MMPGPSSYHRHRFPAEIINHAVWLYHVFSLSLRDVELILPRRCGRHARRRRKGQRPQVTSQLPVAHRHGRIGNPTMADAVLDRLGHSGHRIGLRGESLRNLRLFDRMCHRFGDIAAAFPARISSSSFCPNREDDR